MRRAVIIVNLIDIIGTLITLSIVVAAHRRVKNDEEEQEMEKMEQALRGVIWMALIGWFLNFYSLYGAFTFRLVPVAINAFYLFLTYFAEGAIQTKAAKEHNELNYSAANWILNAIITLLYIYPHAMFVLEVRAGILTPATYSRENQSCCCV